MTRAQELSRRGPAVAWLALLAFAAGVAVLLVGTWRHWGTVAIALLCLAVGLASAWLLLSRRGLLRVVAVGLGSLAVVALAVALVGDGFAVVLAVGLALLAVSAWATRTALAAQYPDQGAPAPPAAPTPRHPALIMNLRSGGGKADRFELERRCRDRGIEPIVLTPGDDLEQLAVDAIARGADVIGMAGGDGSQALVASVASRSGIPLVVVPAGTRNHFALDLGLDRADVVGALDAFTDGVDRVIDLAEVNGRVFVNNASMGVYAEIVQSGEYRDAKLRTSAVILPDLLGPRATPLDLRFTLPSGEQLTTATLVLVSNNSYRLNRLRGAGTRSDLSAGVLGVVVLRVSSASDLERLVALEAAGQVRRSPGWHEWNTTEFELGSTAPVAVGIDGESLTLDPPLRFTIRPAALTVRLPRSATTGTAADPTVDLSAGERLRALWRTAWGRTGAAG